ncbi:MAG: HlyD family efflux transporter periplasmic adaptor subunit [Candidatus Omnitrophica bacterium]|nr:HlyD family efflux transporter periplasmic adaptor subunit [Candidatus Omnitrophota bacterium]
MNKKKIYFIIPVLLVIAVLIFLKARPKASTDEQIKEVIPTVGSIEATISTTGIVLPKNRLEIKPPVNGRLESILVKEGQQVKVGQSLAWMSSTERAALLDAAQSQGETKVKYWEEVYKPIVLLAPINGEVIVATVQPGQTVTSNEAVIVLSDHLIVRAQVDETDIGRIKLNQKALIALDAYPETKIKAIVEHIYYESKTVNNVTIYEADVIPEEVPLFFRSGMNATVDFIEQGKENTLLIPEDALYKEKDGTFVYVKQNNGGEPLKVAVKLGISDGKNVEVISGINQNDSIIVKTKKYTLPKNTAGNNPFMPGRQR